ncbi:PduM family microcompartment protein [Levilactobacillus brevis]|nr:PduM family microcompartment protein [Levilactobacillus brevis]
MVNDLEQLVAQVLTKLKQRERRTYDCVYDRHAAVPDTQVFLDHATVTVANLSIELVSHLYRLDTTDPWVAWLLQAIDYRVQLRLVVNDLSLQFIPRTMLLDWPVIFMTPEFRQIRAVYPHAIARATIAGLPDKTILVVTPTQRLTAEARDTLSRKQMNLQMRTDEACIWQK